MKNNRFGFTLIEMLIVVGIIGILITIVTVAFGGATESARSAKCKANLRSLANAANALGLQYDYYPMAGGISCYFKERGSMAIQSHPGWISYMRNEDISPFYGCGNAEDDIYIITNGTLWKACGCNLDLYKCPTFVKDYRHHHRKDPLWTYVMNSRFAYDESMGTKKGGKNGQGYKWPGTVKYATVNPADRIVMFAELPRGGVEGKDANFTKYLGDSVLQYRTGEWKGEPESIGFVHKGNKGRYYGNVVFVDGHVETVMEPPGANAKNTSSSKGISGVDLTQALCNGWDYILDGDGYHFAKGVEDLEEFKEEKKKN